MAPVLAGQYGPEGLEFPDGRPAKLTHVLVRRMDGGTAFLYQDKERTTQAANPTTTDRFGNVLFKAAPGEYELVINDYVIPILVPVHPLDPGFGVGGEGEGGYIHNQTVGVMLVQIAHGLPWHPQALCIETAGDIIEPDKIRYPATGLMEVEFQVVFSGTIYLS